MFKNFVYNKTFKMISFLIILAIILIFPTSTKYELDKDKKSNETKENVFLLSSDNLISSTNISLKYDSNEDKIKNIVELLIMEGKYADIIPNKYKAVLPIGTELLDLKIKDDSIILNFNSSFLDLDEENIEKYINLISHNCLNDKYNKLYIEVESKLLTNFKNKTLNQPFIKSSSLNVINNTKNYENVKKTNIYFYSKTNDLVPISVLNNSKKDKIEIIIDELSNSNYSNLYSPMNYKVNLISYKIEDENMLLFFDDSIYDNVNHKVVLKPVYDLLEVSIFNNYPVKNIKIYVNNKEIKKSSIKNVE